MDISHSFAKFIAHRFVEVFYNSLVSDIDQVIELFVNDSVLTLSNPNSQEKTIQGIDDLKSEIKLLHDKTSQYEVHVKTVDAQNIDKNKIIVNVVVQLKNISNPEDSELYVHLFGLEGQVHEKNASYRVTNFIIRYINIPQSTGNQSTTSPIESKTTNETQTVSNEKKEEVKTTEIKEETQTVTNKKPEPSKEQPQKKYKKKKQDETKSWANVVSPNAGKVETEEKKDADSEEKPKRQFRDQHKKNEHWKGGQRPRGGSGGYRGRGGHNRNKKTNQKPSINNGVSGGTSQTPSN